MKKEFKATIINTLVDRFFVFSSYSGLTSSKIQEEDVQFKLQMFKALEINANYSIKLLIHNVNCV